MEYDCILIRLGEIALKGKNRSDFENALLSNIKDSLKIKDPNVKVSKIYSGYIVEGYSNEDKIKKALSKVAGLSIYCPARKVKNDIDEIKKTAKEIAKENKPESFKIDTKRSNKGFPMSSMDINRSVGEYVLNETNTKVSVTNPALTIYIDITEKGCFMYHQKIQGIGGLPVGTSGEVISLISGGIDSPVASFLANKRGCHITYLTFDSHPFTAIQAIEKVKELVKILSDYQTDTVLYVVPFADIQKEIKEKCYEKNRTILYRRMMIRIANEIAKKNGAKALITGEAIGQVASQTIDNISCIEEVTEIPIFRPLIMFDKQEIVDIAKKIETYEISIKPYADCCTVFQPANPATHAKISELLDDEAKLDCKKLILKALEKVEVVKF